VGIPLAIPGVLVLIAPAALREFVLFRKRNEKTRELAKNIPNYIHLGGY
jgi:hypothetical protein